MNLDQITRQPASKALRFALIFAALSLTLSCTCTRPEIVWTEGEAHEGTSVHTIVIRNASALPEDWTIWFSQLSLGVNTLEGSDAIVEGYQGNLHRIIPAGVRADSLVIRYETSPLLRHRWAPEGYVLQDMSSKSIKGTPLKVTNYFLPLASDGQRWWDYNASLNVKPVSCTDIIPAPKRISDKPFECSDPAGRSAHGWYSISIDEQGNASIEANDEDGRFYAETTLAQLRQNAGPEATLPRLYIEDWPDLQYRGFMLDVSRNFTSVGNVRKIIDLIARYKVNYLHLHLGDDEGWRLEVDGIPELTEVGAFHCLNPEKGLQPSYDGCTDPSSDALSNGFYTKKEYIEILRYAWKNHIKVIPEFDTPGHSRAAIYAMKAYEKRTGDSSMRLQDPTDSSRYSGPQGYTDNVMSVWLESVYTFMDHLFDCLIAVYDEAGVPLDAIHIGGDEVSKDAWYGEPLHPLFLGRVADIAAEKGVKIAGWQEIATCNDAEVAAKLKKVMFMNNVWNTAWGNSHLPYEIAAAGYPTIMSNVEYTYTDQAYSENKQELAHSWACYIDDTKSLQLPVRRMDNIIGVQAQHFSETIRCFEDLCYDNLPKALGVFERGWNIDCTQSPSEFYSRIVYHEMPWWDENGFAYHIPQPGLKFENGRILTNSAIPGAVIDITHDGRQAIATYGTASSWITTL